MGKLIIEGNEVYEIDEECMNRKNKERQRKQISGKRKEMVHPKPAEPRQPVKRGYGAGF